MLIHRLFVVRYPEFGEEPGTPLDDFLNYLFETPTNKLADKYQRGKQALENKELAHRIFKSVHMSVMAIDSQCVSGEFVEAYFKICSDRPKTKKRKIEEVVHAQLSIVSQAAQEHDLVKRSATPNLPMTVPSGTDVSNIIIQSSNEALGEFLGNNMIVNDTTSMHRPRDEEDEANDAFHSSVGHLTTGGPVKKRRELKKKAPNIIPQTQITTSTINIVVSSVPTDIGPDEQCVV